MGELLRLNYWRRSRQAQGNEPPIINDRFGAILSEKTPDARSCAVDGATWDVKDKLLESQYSRAKS
jgi:hypothetical protein